MHVMAIPLQDAGMLALQTTSLLQGDVVKVDSRVGPPSAAHGIERARAQTNAVCLLYARH